MKLKLLIILNLILVFITIINIALSQSYNLKTVFRTYNNGFKFITNQLRNLEFKISADNDSAFLKFGYDNVNSGLNNSTISSKFSIRPSFYSGSIIYSSVPNDYGGESYISMEIQPNATSVIFRYNDTERGGIVKLARIYANLEDSIAIYNCSPADWLVSNPVNTCLNKFGYYKEGQAPVGASTTTDNRYYFDYARQYRNPQHCFGSQGAGRVLQEICTGDCNTGSDDTALTICVRK
ncbi:MAG: hypothetical protein KatS3mg094_429 [Candidatus Parcubacteria bacterium]|nr:MAG: hypothetical protein KatS3mg094_429 [Candidatus Parcubacteria bacterium]